MGIAIFVILAVLGILALLLIPRSAQDEDGPLPRDIETRVLLGESAEAIERSTRPPSDELDDPTADR